MTAVATVQARQALGWIRIALGVVSWLSPGLLVRAFGAQVRDHPPAPVIARTFAAREVAVGAGALAANTAGERDRWLAIGMAIDAADAVALTVAGLRRQIPRPIAALGAVGAVGAVLVAATLRAGEGG